MMPVNLAVFSRDLKLTDPGNHDADGPAGEKSGGGSRGERLSLLNFTWNRNIYFGLNSNSC